MLTLRPYGRVGSGFARPEDLSVFQYMVEGLPSGQEASIAKMKGSHWHVLRRHGGVQGPWTGDYETAEEALAALQREVEAE